MSKPDAYIVQTEDPILDLTQYDQKVLQQIVETRVALYWDYKGDLRRVSDTLVAHVFNLIQGLQNRQQLSLLQVSVNPPPTLGYIWLDQTVKISSQETKPDPSRLLHLPRRQPE